MPDTGFDNLLIVAAVALAAPLLAALALLGGNSAVQVGVAYARGTSRPSASDARP